MLTFSAGAFAAQVSIVSYTINYDSINRFVNIGETIDVSGASITYLTSDRKQGKKNITNDMLKAMPDTSKPGYFRAEFTVLETDFYINFMILDKAKSASVFKDVKASDWSFVHIDRCVKGGIFEGKSATQFAPNAKITRAEFCAVMYNIFKNDKALKKIRNMNFYDVAEGAWYYTAVKACADAGIISGTGYGLFSPNGYITREDAAIIMMGLIMGKDNVAALDCDKTLEGARRNGIAANDFDNTHDYAKNSVAAALGVIYTGDAIGNINPRSYITRAECSATMSSYFFKDFEKKPITPMPEPEPEKPEPEPELPPLIYLSPSNQMSNRYTGVNTTEGEQMQLIAAVVKRELEKKGYRVFVADVKTPIKDTIPYGAENKDDGIICRAEEALAMGADAYIAIHSNAGGGQGTRSFYNGNNPQSTAFARAVHNRVAALTPTPESASAFSNDIVTSKPFAEVWRPKMANTLLEVEFHDQKPYAQWIVNNREAIGIAIANGIDDYFKSLK